MSPWRIEVDPTDDPREKTFKRDVLFAIAMASNLLAFLLLVAMPGAPSSFLFLIAMVSNLRAPANCWKGKPEVGLVLPL